MNIPKIMTHIWIGPKNPPLNWMNTWKMKHPEWDYKVFDNERLENTKFKCQHIIDEYMKREKYAGVADIIRYETLYAEGGFFPPADAICHHNTDELWNKPEDWCYTVYESETLRPGFVSPIYACNPGNEFVKLIIDTLSELKPHELKEPWQSTGNQFLHQLIKKHKPKNVKIFPSHYFIPVHFKNKLVRYTGTDKVYADQMFGSTKNLY